MKRAAVILGILSFVVGAAALTFGQAAQQAPAAGRNSAGIHRRGSTSRPRGRRRPRHNRNLTPGKRRRRIRTRLLWRKPPTTSPPNSPTASCGSSLQECDAVVSKSNNAEKTEAMGRKVLGIDGDDPEALTTVAEVIAERTRDSDIDKDQRFDEGIKMAQKALQTMDTDVSVPPGTPQDKLDAYKSGLRSQAYSTMGAIEYNKGNFPAAQTNFEKAIDAYPSEPYALDVLRLALSLDKQRKYPEALKVANRAVDMTKESDQLGATSAARARPPAATDRHHARPEPASKELTGGEARLRNVMKSREIMALEESLGHHFQRQELIEQALTHSSQARELQAAGEARGLRGQRRQRIARISGRRRARAGSQRDAIPPFSGFRRGSIFQTSRPPGWATASTCSSRTVGHRRTHTAGTRRRTKRRPRQGQSAGGRAGGDSGGFVSGWRMDGGPRFYSSAPSWNRS